MEKTRNGTVFNADAATTLLTSTDTLLSTSPLPSDPLLDGHIKDSETGTLDPFVIIENVDSEGTGEEYTTPSKRLKTDA